MVAKRMQVSTNHLVGSNFQKNSGSQMKDLFRNTSFINQKQRICWIFRCRKIKSHNSDFQKISSFPDYDHREVDGMDTHSKQMHVFFLVEQIHHLMTMIFILASLYCHVQNMIKTINLEKM